MTRIKASNEVRLASVLSVVNFKRRFYVSMHRQFAAAEDLLDGLAPVQIAREPNARAGSAAAPAAANMANPFSRIGMRPR